MAKTCLNPTCNNGVFGGGYCRNHQYMRTDKKPKPIKTSTAKGRKKKAEKAAKFPGDAEFYMEIWMERKHVCYNCDTTLNSPLTLYFDHILEKGDPKYAHLRHEKENICLLCWDCHTSKTKIPKLLKLREETLKLFFEK